MAAELINLKLDCLPTGEQKVVGTARTFLRLSLVDGDSSPRVCVFPRRAPRTGVSNYATRAAPSSGKYNPIWYHQFLPAERCNGLLDILETAGDDSTKGRVIAC